jgi:hypothetical protein
LSTVRRRFLGRPRRRLLSQLALATALAGILIGAPGAAGASEDDSPPVVIPRYFGTLGTNDWYRSDLTLNWEIADPEGPILEVDPVGCAPFQLTVDHPGTTRICSARSAGGRTTVETKLMKVDETPPQVTSKTPSREPDKNGWYNDPLTVAFAGTDNLSGIDSCSRPSYSAPDSANASVPGTCTDLAGNPSAQSSFGPFKYDGTAPTLVPRADRAPNGEGWYRQQLTVSFPGTDATSTIATCSDDHIYSGPDDGTASVSGSCTDKAGNTVTEAFRFKYDETAPTVVPDPDPNPNANGWHREKPLTLRFPGNDDTSGIASCTPAQPYSGNDTNGTPINGFCTDKAGNRTDRTYTVRYDATAPQLTPAASRGPDVNGWHNHELTIRFPGSDLTSQIDFCTPNVAYSAPDSATASVTGSCTDKAGNTTTRSFGFKYDGTAPQINPTPERPPDSNGWYNEPLSVTFAGFDAVSGLQAACGSATRYEGPDGVFAVISGTCADNAGNVGFGSMALKYDATAPQVSGASADRAPDGNGWYNKPVTIRFHGSDASSDVESCSVVDYAGPNNSSASVSGSCRDRAGNPSGVNAFSFKYDAAPPSVTKLTVKAGNRSAVLTWETSPDTGVVELARTAGQRSTRTIVYRGTGRTFTDTRLENGVRYRYALTGYDEAMNVATAEAVATPLAPLVSPKAGAVVSAPPRLAWRAVPKATYYNAQVWRNGRIFSAWPKGTSVQLRRTWVYNGRRYRLTPGRYRWYVWPGFGKRAKRDFGRLIGSSAFVVK